MKRRVLLNAAIIGMILLTSCSLTRRNGDDAAVGLEASASNEATLACSEECRERGQCGVAERGRMVLLGATAPATINHDMAIPDGTVVQIEREVPYDVTQYSDDVTFSISFYQVTVPENGSGWVAGWCVSK